MSKKYSESKDLKHIGRFYDAAREVSLGFVPTGIAFIFLLGVFYVSSFIVGEVRSSTVIIIAGVLGGYMALNIGANDVANNVSPAVGSKALTMGGALVLAAIFESAGAMIAGGEVVTTIKNGIIDPQMIESKEIFITLMMSALISAAIWLNLATYLGAPVSTTHSIVGGVMGGGIAAAGISIVNWTTMGKIVASWIISPLMGGIIAALFYQFIIHVVLNKKDKLGAAKTWVPIVVSIMASAFTMYLILKGLKKIWKPEIEIVWLIGALIILLLPFLIRPFIKSASMKMENRAKSVNKLFTLPLIISAALLSFAHGANDVANAVGPLAAIVNIASGDDIASKVGIPIWVMMIGAFGISVGLILFGPKIIRNVGEKITKLDQVRAFCIALAAAITVIIASQLGIPVSSTHITVGGVFGVGLYREVIGHKKRKKASKELSDKKIAKRKLVRRWHVMSIASAWVITVPCAALMSAGIYYVISHFGINNFM